MKPHKHADLIHAWANGAQIQVQTYRVLGSGSQWYDEPNPTWQEDLKYRIKPREFEEGAYYPLISKRGVRCFGKFCKAGLREAFLVNGEPETEDKFQWVGEKLEIDWPEETE